MKAQKLRQLKTSPCLNSIHSPTNLISISVQSDPLPSRTKRFATFHGCGASLVVLLPLANLRFPKVHSSPLLGKSDRVNPSDHHNTDSEVSRVTFSAPLHL